jgi:hypothetical protein
MSELLAHAHQMQLSAWLLLAVYTALALALLPRELRFLRDVEPRTRRKFLVLDVLLQICVLLILLPCGLVAKLTYPLFVLIFAGFTGLWIVIIIMSYQRYIYTYRMLAAVSQQHTQQTAELLRRGLEKHQHGNSQPPAGQGKGHAG